MAMSNNGAVRMRVKIHAERSLDNSDMIQCINHGVTVSSAMGTSSGNATFDQETEPASV
jgi:hypothetical protein